MEGFQQRCRVLADSYLDHILLIAKVGDRGANLRDFVDPWWAFERGEPFVKRNRNPSQRTMNNPCGCSRHERSRLLQLDFVSSGAWDALERGACKDVQERGADDRLIVDHSVPLARIAQELFGRDEWTKQELEAFLRQNLKRGLLTRAEDALLDAKDEAGLSLNASMTDGWRLGDDPFARYNARGIAAHVPASLAGGLSE